MYEKYPKGAGQHPSQRPHQALPSPTSECKINGLQRRVRESDHVFCPMLYTNESIQDIMAHPKVVLFLTHCGMHGVLEAVWNEVPMVGMPVFIDQVGN